MARETKYPLSSTGVMQQMLNANAGKVMQPSKET